MNQSKLCMPHNIINVNARKFADSGSITLSHTYVRLKKRWCDLQFWEMRLVWQDVYIYLQSKHRTTWKHSRQKNIIGMDSCIKLMNVGARIRELSSNNRIKHPVSPAQMVFIDMHQLTFSAKWR